jgi:hypothetical protein
MSRRAAHATTSIGDQLLPLGSVLVELQQHSGTLVDMEKGWKGMFPFLQMSGKTPTRDTIVAEGMRCTDGAVEASGIAGLRLHTQRRGGVP